MRTISLILLILCIPLIFAGCDHRNGVMYHPKEMEVIVSAETTVPGGALVKSKSRSKSRSKAHDDTIYVSLRDSTNRVFGLRAMLEKKLADSGKRITANPSEASCIIQVQILSAQKVDPEQARTAMRARYGGELPPEGNGAAMIMADIIFAPRVVPAASSNKQLLANTSARSVKERCMLRIGVLAPGAGRLDTSLGSMSEKLAEAIGDTFNSTY